MATSNKLPTHLEARLIRPIPGDCSLIALARSRIERFLVGPDVTKARRDNHLKVALLWSADFECEIVPDDNDTWIVIDVSLLRLLAMANGQFLEAAEPVSLPRSMRALIGQACLLNGDWSASIRLAPDADHRIVASRLSCAEETLLGMQIDYILRHEFYHYLIKTDSDFAQRSLEHYVDRVIPVLSGFYPLPMFLGQAAESKLGMEAVSKLRNAEDRRTRESLKWSLNRAEEEICDVCAVSDLYRENANSVAMALTAPATVAMVLVVRQQIFAAAVAIQGKGNPSIELVQLDEMARLMSTNRRYEARIINASMRSATVAALSSRMEDIQALNETSSRYSIRGIRPIREAARSAETSFVLELEQSPLVRRNDPSERLRAFGLYGYPPENRRCDVELN